MINAAPQLHCQVMALDDDAFMLKLLTRKLGNLGYSQVFAYRCGKDALAALTNEARNVSLILCDLRMPKMDGVEFVRHLVRIKYSGSLVFVSGEDQRIVQAAAKLARAHFLNVLGTVNKPIDREQLTQVLGRTLAHTTSLQRKPVRQYSRHELLRAIANRELINHYQPKVDLATGAVTGVECLVRWRHPDDGLVYPDQFLPAIEEHGLMGELTSVVVTSALQQARSWHVANADLSVAINVSMSSLGELNFAELITDAAHGADFPLEKLIIEVTESKLMLSPLACVDILTRLRLKRVGLSIDDFGVGHSSMAKLRDLPFSELKFDRSFVHGAHRDELLAAFLEAGLSLARRLGLSTVAEGVEDQADWDYLRQCGCRQAQGWFIAKAMPGEDLLDWIPTWNLRAGAMREAAA